ncbi:MAG: ADP-ribosylglycohydrolase family protein [Candidatus Latescibacteria bacterium]|nr:ADP-ribosylglycohydrolase family protein [Candidatus Latescibacterota bacterium]
MDTLGKIRGGLIGSAIGDAMGGPVEMWAPHRISETHGWVDSLLPYTMPPNPTYVWEPDAIPGSYTDDTRLKLLAVRLILEEASDLTPISLASRFVACHANAKDGSLEKEWYSEWAAVGRSFIKNGGTGYDYPGLHGFYGGEMVCGGLITLPAVGFVFEGNEEAAYDLAYRLAFFDLGYARDATALATVFVARAMRDGASVDSVLSGADYDPYNLSGRQIFGRVCGRYIERAIDVAKQAKTRQELIADMHEQLIRSTPCDPAEMLAFTVAILKWVDGDPKAAIPLAVNAGRDNDSIAGVVGMIAGTLHGIDALPMDWIGTVLKANPEPDIEDMASQLVEVVVKHAGNRCDRVPNS